MVKEGIMATIHFSDMLAIQGRHVVITDKVSNVNRLLRVYERDSKKAVSHVYAKGLIEIAREFIIAYNAWNIASTQKSEIYQAPVIIDSKVQACLIYSIIREHRYSNGNNTFPPEKSVSMDTAMELCRIIDQIRSNSTTDAYDADVDVADTKIAVINDIGLRYENLLKEKGYYDRVSIIKKMISIINSDEFGKDRNEKKEKLECYLTWIKNCDFYIFDNEKFTETEEELIKLLCNIITGITDDGNSDINKINIAAVPKNNVRFEFFRAYGVFNEVVYIADKIKNENIASGDVSILYTDAIYEKIIAGVFDEYGIKYELSDGCSAKTYEHIDILIALLDFALDDFSYESLEKVARSKGIWIKEIESGVYNVFIKCIREGIGWGIDRYRQYVSNAKLPDDEKRAVVIKAYKEFLTDVCDIFDSKTKSIDIYDGLIAFIKKYGNNKILLNTTIIPLLKAGRIYIKESDSDNFEASVKFIKEYIENLRVKKTCDKNIRAGMVTAYSLNNSVVLERKYNFIIGLTARQFQTGISESPVLSDNELIKYLSNTQILAKDMVSEKKKIFRDCVNSLSEGVIYMGYSTYDTTEFRDMAPASVYMEYFRDINSENDRSLDDYVIKEYTDVYYKIESEKIDEYSAKAKIDVKKQDVEKELNKNPGQQKETADFRDIEYSEEKISDDRELHMSSTALQMLLKCPFQYYYKYEKHIPEKEYFDNTVASWLTPAAKGNLFHYTLQKYCDMLIGTETKIDIEVFEESFQNALEEVKREVPFTSEYTYEKERDEYKNKIQSYIEKLHEKFNDKKDGDWRIIANECKFEFSTIIESDKEKTDNKLVIKFNGSIDRLDGKVDEDGKLKLRIIDYKTGKYDSKKQEIVDRVQIQHFIYARAALNYVNTDEGRKLIQGIFKGDYQYDARCDIEDVLYVFPYEDSDDKYELSVMDEVRKVLEKSCDYNEKANKADCDCEEENKVTCDNEEVNKATDEYIILPDDINEVILKTKGELNNNNLEGFMKNANEHIDKKCEDKDGKSVNELKEKKFCEYCTYKHICRRKIK